MEGKIRSVTQAFSTQPFCYSIFTEQQRDNYYDKERAVKEIKLERLTTGTPNEGFVEWYYVGYNFDGKKLFQCLASSMNVEYETIS